MLMRGTSSFLLNKHSSSIHSKSTQPPYALLTRKEYSNFKYQCNSRKDLFSPTKFLNFSTPLLILSAPRSSSSTTSSTSSSSTFPPPMNDFEPKVDVQFGRVEDKEKKGAQQTENKQRRGSGSKDETSQVGPAAGGPKQTMPPDSQNLETASEQTKNYIKKTQQAVNKERERGESNNTSGKRAQKGKDELQTDIKDKGWDNSAPIEGQDKSNELSGKYDGTYKPGAQFDRTSDAERAIRAQQILEQKQSITEKQKQMENQQKDYNNNNKGNDKSNMQAKGNERDQSREQNRDQDKDDPKQTANQRRHRGQEQIEAKEERVNDQGNDQQKFTNESTNQMNDNQNKNQNYFEEGNIKDKVEHAMKTGIQSELFDKVKDTAQSVKEKVSHVIQNVMNSTDKVAEKFSGDQLNINMGEKTDLNYEEGITNGNVQRASGTDDSVNDRMTGKDESSLKQSHRTSQNMNDIDHMKHYPTKDMKDMLAYSMTRLMKFDMNFMSGFYFGKRTLNKWLYHMIFLETIASVPSTAGILARHLTSLGVLRIDSGNIQSLGDMAENERVHLLTALELKKSSIWLRMGVLIGHSAFFAIYCIYYLISPKFCHRFVGYLEEEAIKSYTQLLRDIDNEDSFVYEWGKSPAPPTAKNYWRLDDNATVRDVIMMIRADLAHHSEVNHSFSSTKPL